MNIPNISIDCIAQYLQCGLGNNKSVTKIEGINILASRFKYNLLNLHYNK